jgi:hypothetical protein
MARRFARLTHEIVLREAVKKQDPVRANRAQLKVQKMFEFGERSKLYKEFMKAWNHWRKFYFDMADIEPKTPSQLTMIENCIDYAKTRNMDLNILIACVHRAYQKRKFRPGFGEILIRGEEHYQLYDEVMSDLEKAEHEEGSY